MALTVRTHDPRTGEPSTLLGLPFGPFDPDGHRTFELALRAFVTEQTRFELGYVEQLYTFGDKGRDAPRPTSAPAAARVISVGYLALTPQAVDTHAPDTVWTPFTRFFPWEDWRRGRPALIDEVHRAGAAATGPADARSAAWRARGCCSPSTARPGTRSGCWSATSCSTRPAWRRRRAATASAPGGRAGSEPQALSPALGEPMLSDHRRILATGLGRLRGKLKYRPVVFELTPAGVHPLGSCSARSRRSRASPCTSRTSAAAWSAPTWSRASAGCTPETGGRPAELFRFRRELPARRPGVPGMALPLLREE